jgi:hypothetical protein
MKDDEDKIEKIFASDDKDFARELTESSRNI